MIMTLHAVWAMWKLGITDIAASVLSAGLRMEEEK